MLLVNSSWIKNGNRITILKDYKLNYNGKVFPYKLDLTSNIHILKWDDKLEIVENNVICGWEEEIPLFNRYHPKEWDRFLFMFFKHQYSGDDNIEPGELSSSLWKEWKFHYLNENSCLFKSPRDRSSLRLNRSPSSSPISSPRNNIRQSSLKDDRTKSSPELSKYCVK